MDTEARLARAEARTASLEAQFVEDKRRCLPRPSRDRRRAGGGGRGGGGGRACHMTSHDMISHI